jgi:hypothetical protein
MNRHVHAQLLAEGVPVKKTDQGERLFMDAYVDFLAGRTRTWHNGRWMLDGRIMTIRDGLAANTPRAGRVILRRHCQFGQSCPKTFPSHFIERSNSACDGRT